ncbi:hypothetical protein P691DRAFT_781397 [Macrolepiota fuliginosa MF-IS2]|uniref:DNA replication regulator SLD2 n=1 Tax=Macrolepiota fuliginosa MF-IS2 TaxID=1400762 RepID=A0A9P6C4E2_9AGAR|nr:hypothetical protein P691DRAFT_781397 [Macrolepiota fuliginosa MF-IS2]
MSSDFASLRAEIKAWERNFKETNGREPTIEDIKKQPAVAQKYKFYKKLSKATTATSALISRPNDPPSTPPRATPPIAKPSKLLKSVSRVAEDTAPLASFNPFSPQKKGKGKQIEAIPFNLVRPAASPFASSRKFKTQSAQRQISPDPFPLIQPSQPSTSTQLPPEPPSAISRARKRLRGEPVSPSPNKGKRRRVLSPASLPFPKLYLQGPDSDDKDSGEDEEDNGPDGGNSSIVDDSPMKPAVNGKAFTFLFEETKPTSTADLFGGDTLTAKPHMSSKHLKSALPSMDDELFNNGSQIKKNDNKSSMKTGHTVKSQSSALTKSRSKLVQMSLPTVRKPSNHTRRVTLPQGPASTKRVLSVLESGRNDTANNESDSASPSEPLPSTHQLLPPSPNPNASRQSGKSKPNGARSHQPSKATSRKKAKFQNDDDGIMDDMENDDGSSSDGLSIQQNVQLVHHSRGIRAALPTEEANSETEDPILNYAKRTQPRGKGSVSPVKQGGCSGVDAVLDEEDADKDTGADADAENIEGNLPNELHRVLVLESLKSKKNEYEEKMIVKGLLSGRRVVHYDPRKGEIWGVGEDNRDEFAEDEERGIDEAEDEWEGDPVPWERECSDYSMYFGNWSFAYTLYPNPILAPFVGFRITPGCPLYLTQQPRSKHMFASAWFLSSALHQTNINRGDALVQTRNRSEMSDSSMHPLVFFFELRLVDMAKKTSHKKHHAQRAATPKPPPKPVIKTPILLMLRDPEATKRLMEGILESANGRRALSRVARTCKAFCGLALDVLWRELDSLVPIIGLFPNNIMKKARKPGFGLIRAPESEDWINVMKYCDRVRRITYNEATNNLATVFPLLEDRPCTYILPNLEELTWKVQTASGLERATLFLNPTLKVVNLQVESQLQQFGNFLADLSSRTKLTGFSFASPTFLPDNFTDLLHNQKGLEKVELVAPGALGADIGRWSAKLPRLKSLELDLTGRSTIAVEGFFDKVKQSGYDTPDSIGSHDSGIFSNEEFDFSEFRRSAIRLTDEDEYDGSRQHETGPFRHLKRLHLTGDVSNVNVFLEHLSSGLTHLDLVIEDPPERADWSDFCDLLCERFGETLQSLRISATSKSVSKGEPTNVHLPLHNIVYLPELVRLDIDLPESVVFIPADLERIGYACPRLEVLRLCPLARFQNSAPQINLEALGWLTRGCRNLHTLHVNVDAQPGSLPILQNRMLSSTSLQRLHFGNSWIEDPLQVSVLLSHLMPNLESIKWFQDKNRPHYNETHDKNWQTVSETLPHLQAIRHIERSFTVHAPPPVQRVLLEKCIDATIETLSMGVQVRPQTVAAIIQASPSLVSLGVDATVETRSICIGAAPETEDVGVGATVSHAEVSIDACPVKVSVSTAVDMSVFQEMEVAVGPDPRERGLRWQKPFLQPVYAILASLYRIFIFYPLSLPSRFHTMFDNLKRKNSRRNQNEGTVEGTGDISTDNDISMETVRVSH